VVDFKFEQLAHVRSKKSASSSSSNNLSSSRLNGGVESDSSNADGPESNTPFTVLKKAEVELLVGGKPVTYAVVIKVLPTDDKVRQSVLLTWDTYFCPIAFWALLCFFTPLMKWMY
jgi:hypothetical protein